MPPTKNAKKSAPKNKKVVKSAPKEPKVDPTPAPVQETPTQVEQVAPVSTEAPVVNDTPYLEEFTLVVSELDTAMTTIRNLKARLQKLEKQVHRDTKALNKKANGKRARKPRDPDAPKSGFAKEGPVSDEMRKFLGMKKDDLISRTDVTKRIHEYCKSKNLQNPSDKRQIKPDASLRKLLKMNKDDDLTFFNLQKYMKVHFPNKEGVYPTA
jgi:chromatin remodeling complex protein RSC6